MTASIDNSAAPNRKLSVGTPYLADEDDALTWRQRLRLPLMIAGPLLLVLVGGFLYLTGGRYVSTDDAYVSAARASISPQVGGRVAVVLVRDNQQVGKGDILFRIDDSPYRIAMEQAAAQLAGARMEIDARKATYRQKQADLRAAQDTLAYQLQEWNRQKRLLPEGVVSRAQFDQTTHALETAKQQVAAAEHQIGSLLAGLNGDPDLPVDRHPLVQQAQAALDRANLDLSYCLIRAPEDGIVTKVEQLQPGDSVKAASPVFTLVSNHDVWIEANFKETDLTHMRPGQSASVTIDAYPGQPLTARVVSVSPGTGSAFSMLPAENATGNWVKVVQRLPVRLEVDSPDPAIPLRAGLSATVEVDTQYKRELF